MHLTRHRHAGMRPASPSVEIGGIPMVPFALAGVGIAAGLWWLSSIQREKSLTEQTRLRLRPLPDRSQEDIPPAPGDFA